jgi:hypothetical protein
MESIMKEIDLDIEPTLECAVLWATCTARCKHEILSLTERISVDEQWLKTRELAKMEAVISAINTTDGKPIYSNEQARKAETAARLVCDAEYGRVKSQIFETKQLLFNATYQYERSRRIFDVLIAYAPKGGIPIEQVDRDRELAEEAI